jgi:hypothetical protein
MSQLVCPLSGGLAAPPRPQMSLSIAGAVGRVVVASLGAGTGVVTADAPTANLGLMSLQHRRRPPLPPGYSPPTSVMDRVAIAKSTNVCELARSPRGSRRGRLAVVAWLCRKP